jgi:hypothetical protein
MNSGSDKGESLRSIHRMIANDSSPDLSRPLIEPVNFPLDEIETNIAGVSSPVPTSSGKNELPALGDALAL